MQEGERPPQRHLWLLNLLTLLEPLDQYIREIKRITGLESLDVNEKLTMIRQAGGAVSVDLEAHFEAFSGQLRERRAELERALAPPRPAPVEEMQRLLAAVAAALEEIALRDQLMRQWGGESPDEICRAYEASLAAGDAARVELFEAYAEEVLARKGNEAALAAFRQRREQAKESRFTPEQVRAKEELREVEYLETSFQILRTGLLSVLKPADPGVFPALGAP